MKLKTRLWNDCKSDWASSSGKWVGFALLLMNLAVLNISCQEPVDNPPIGQRGPTLDGEFFAAYDASIQVKLDSQTAAPSMVNRDGAQAETNAVPDMMRLTPRLSDTGGRTDMGFQHDASPPNEAVHVGIGMDATIAPDEGSATEPLAEILDELRRNPEAALRHYAQEFGWPVRLGADEVMVVTTSDLTYVAGDHDGWSGTELTQELGFRWGIIPWVAGARYKFTDGQNWSSDPWSRAYLYDDFGEMSQIAPSAAHLERWFMPESGDMAARTIRVWVPEGHIQATAYMHDGQNLFNPMSLWGGWRLQAAVPDGLMIVGIDNSPDRIWEYTPTADVIDGRRVGGGGDTYGAYLENNIRPFIQSHYGEGSAIGLIGSSLGGLISLHIAKQFIGRYQFVASLSGTVGWGRIGGDEDTLIERWRVQAPRGLRVYLDSGGPLLSCIDSDGDGIEDDNEANRDNYCQTKQLASVLTEAGWRVGHDLWYRHAPNAPHNEAAWAQRVSFPLRLLRELATPPRP